MKMGEMVYTKLIYKYTIMILHRLSIYSSMKHYLLSTHIFVLHSLDTLSDVRIKVFNASLLITMQYHKPKPSLLGASLSVVNNFSLISSFSFNYLAVIIVCIAFE
jgi:hypothetical protein